MSLSMNNLIVNALSDHEQMNIENCRAIKSANVLILILQISINIRALAPLLCNATIQAIPACCCSSKCIVNNGDNIKCDQNF